MTNIALIVLDTLRKDRFDKHFDWLPGIQFENTWSTSHWTVPAHASLFTGRYASEVGVYRNAETLDWSEPVLAEFLQEKGYTTRAFSANPNISWQFDFHRGFEQFEGSWRLQALDRNMFDWDSFIARTRDMGPQRYAIALWKCIVGDYNTVPSLEKGLLLKMRDLGLGTETVDDGAQSALDFIRETDFGHDEFLFMNLMEAHSPYNAPEEYQSVEPPEIKGLEATFGEPDADPDRIRQSYDDEVRYLSDMYRKMFEELKRDFSVIITVSDHGELLGEHGAWEHIYGLYPELTHVPLSIYTGDGNGTRIESVNLIDVYQTVLASAGITDQSQGRDLREEVGEGGEFLTEYHGISDRHYHSLEDNGFNDIDYLKTELNGLATDSYYYHETFDGHESYGESPYDDPASRLADIVNSIEKREVSEDNEIDDALREQLEDLGYV